MILTLTLICVKFLDYTISGFKSSAQNKEVNVQSDGRRVIAISQFLNKLS